MLLLTILPYALLLCLNEGVNGDDHPNLQLLPEECGFIDGERVTNSKYAQLHEFPWMALIFRIADDGGRQFVCTGTVINERYVLTVAHCVNLTKTIQVRVGDYDTQHEVDCEGEGRTLLCEDQFQDIDISERIIHEKFQRIGNISDDIALIRLKTAIDFSHKNAAPICLPTTNELKEKPLVGQEAIVAGWELMINGQTSSKMLKINTPIKNNEECSEAFHGAINVGPDMICTGGVEGVCPLLSGSPLMLPCDVKEKQFRYIQYGITFSGTRGCNSNQWSAYTDVTKYMDWILNNLKP